MYKVYILESEKNGRFYIGFSADVEARLERHNSGKVKSTRAHRPFKVVYTEEYQTSTEARKREYYLKTLKSRQAIRDLITRVGQ